MTLTFPVVGDALTADSDTLSRSDIVTSLSASFRHRWVNNERLTWRRQRRPDYETPFCKTCRRDRQHGCRLIYNQSKCDFQLQVASSAKLGTVVTPQQLTRLISLTQSAGSWRCCWRNELITWDMPSEMITEQAWMYRVRTKITTEQTQIQTSEAYRPRHSAVAAADTKSKCKIFFKKIAKNFKSKISKISSAILYVLASTVLFSEKVTPLPQNTVTEPQILPHTGRFLLCSEYCHFMTDWQVHG